MWVRCGFRQECAVRMVAGLVVLLVGVGLMSGCAELSVPGAAQATGIANGIMLSTPAASTVSMGDTLTSVTTNLAGYDWEPSGLAPTFTEKPIWIVLGLVVLGWIVMAADFPDN